MALYMKQDFTPPVLSRRWIAIKFRPNMLLQSRQNIISILESGLLFREDSIEVEQEAPSAEAVWGAAGGGKGGWLTRGEGAMTVATLAACVCVFPPRSFSRTALLNLSLYTAIPVIIRCTHRAMCRGVLSSLLRCMRDYLALARRAAACLKEYAALHTQLGSLSTVIESTRTMLCRQQSELSIVMTRASSALLGNAPWLRDDVAWHAVERDDTDNLMKIHHAFLVVQSTLLKHIAMAHYIPPQNVQRLYKNHNERLYWIHNTLIRHLLGEFKENFESLERMYRLLKNSANRDSGETKKLGAGVKTNWVYSDIHTGIARVCLELKLALNKSTGLDMFLDACTNDQDIKVDVLNKDVDDLIETITKCLATVQSAQLRLRKLQGKVVDSTPKPDLIVESSGFTIIEDKEHEAVDEVFYLLKTEDDCVSPPPDVTAAPGEKEKEATKIVLSELRRKLGKREDLMRERERQALVKTMPDLKNIPEFPRQIKFDEYIIRKGYISKIKRKDNKKRMFKNYKIQSKLSKNKLKKLKLNVEGNSNESHTNYDIYTANVKSKLFTVSSTNKNILINKRCVVKPEIMKFSSGISDLDEVNSQKAGPVEQIKIKFTKKDLELTESSESDLEYHRTQRALLNDIRRHRATRKKNHPLRPRPRDNVDESLKPIEYNFGTGLAMASVLQVNARFLNMAREEVFNGDGEVSNDSGNDEDA